MEEIKVEKSLINEIINRRNLGDKKFHSDTSINEAFGEDELARQDPPDDPGVHNSSLNAGPSYEKTQARRRTRSTPGPESGGNLVTATAARAARRRVNYHPDVEQTLSADRLPRLQPSRLEDESGTVTPIDIVQLRQSPVTTFPNNNSNNRNADAKSISSYRMYTGAPYRKRFEVMMDAQSIRSVETQAPPPTNPEDNKKLTARYITLIASSMYAVALVTLGLIIYLADQFMEPTISPIYTIILIIIGFLYHVYLMIDIQIYKNKTRENQEKKYQYEEAVAEYYRRQEEDFPSLSQENRLPGIPPPGLVPLKHDYCFSRGRHSGSFYLKLGAAGFALGHLVHSVLLLVVELSYLADEAIDNNECMDYTQLAVDILSPLYCFVQLYFVFKYSNVIVLKKQGLAHVAFMHIIGSSLCFWISAIIRETILALTLYAQTKYKDEEYSSSIEDTFDYTPINSKIIGNDGLYNENCVGSEAISAIFQRFSPYLYPFSIEFNILIVAVYFIIWNNIGNCPNEDNSYSEIYNSSSDDNNSVCKIPTASEDNDFTSNMVIYADCHASNRGLFAGLLVMVGIVGMLILGFVFNSVGEDFQSIGAMLSDCTKLTLHTAMLFCCILAFMQTSKLDINEHPISLLDDILLFVCIPPFFMETVFSLVATVTILNWVKSFDFVIMLIQILIQTPLIMDGLRRCSNSRKLRRSKPGRELMMFLIITNVAMWLFYTFSFKSPEQFDERYEFYGKELWTILGHVSLPLIMFYRFHSSVCFVDIWGSAYKPGAEH